MKPPSLKAILIGLIPFGGMCFTVSLWDRVDPMIFGIPFNLFWLIAWMVLTTLCMAIAHRIERDRSAATSKKEDRAP